MKATIDKAILGYKATRDKGYADYLDFLFVDYVNNFITVDRFAEDYGISKEQALHVIDLGREIHEVEE